MPISRIMALNAKEWWIILLGILGALINGSIFPIFAIIFGEILTVITSVLYNIIVIFYK